MHWLDLSLITALQLGVGGGVTVVVVGAAVTVGYVVRAPGVDFRHWPTFTLAEPDTCSDACMQLVARRKERESAEQGAGSAKSWSESLYWTWVALVLAAAALAAAGVAAASIPGGGVAAAILFALATAALITAAYAFGAYMKALAEYARLVQDADDARRREADARQGVVNKCSASEAASCLGAPAGHDPHPGPPRPK